MWPFPVARLPFMGRRRSHHQRASMLIMNDEIFMRALITYVR